MPTKNEISAKIRENLNDVGISWYTSSDIDESINDGYNEICIFTGCIEKSAELVFQNELSYYDFVTLIPDFYSVTAIYNKRNNHWLSPSSSKKLDLIRQDWEKWNGEPLYFFQQSPRHVCIIPSLVSASGSFIVYYRAKATTLNSLDTPTLFLDQQDILELYSTGDMLEAAHEWIKAGNSLQHYNAELYKMKERVKRLGFPDRTMYVKRFDIYPRPL